jgi:hypothetical protein
MEGLTEADGARAQALGVLAALISTVINSRLRFCGMNVRMIVPAPASRPCRGG